MGPVLGRGDRVVCTAWASSPVSVFCAHTAGGVQRWLCASAAPGARKSHPCSLSRPTPGGVQVLLPPPPAAGCVPLTQVHRGLINSHHLSGLSH